MTTAPLFDRARAEADRVIADGMLSRIWARDPRVWTAAAGPGAERAVANRLGWLHAPTAMRDHLPAIERLAAAVAEEGIETIYLLGMGGSSLCAEVLQSVAASRENGRRLRMLDTTDEWTIADAVRALDPTRALVIVASKSGTTTEVAALERFFHRRISSARPDAGAAFVAITDPGTPLEALARDRGYRAIFLNPADIGGRFSALSLFGLVPAALVGMDPKGLLDGGEAMAQGGHEEGATNAAVQLGALLATAALDGRDKLTLVIEPPLEALGAWIEQLVAESTGKAGKGILPVVDEPRGDAQEYGPDRLFCAIETAESTAHADFLHELERAGHPVHRITTRASALGAEFFRWELAVAIAGALLGVNPFDEPNVQEAKDRTRAFLDEYVKNNHLPQPAPGSTGHHVQAYGRIAAVNDSPAGAVRAALATLASTDYFAILSYLPPTADILHALQSLRATVRDRFKVATTLGVGPRYLHSTGQYHKGGPNTGVFVVLTCADETTTEVPGAGYSFAILKRAQALGDVQALEAHGRRVVHLHFSVPSPDVPLALSELSAGVFA